MMLRSLNFVYEIIYLLQKKGELIPWQSLKFLESSFSPLWNRNREITKKNKSIDKTMVESEYQ